ncbi:MAG: hypothetical protein RL112_1880 [Planctomycetota bacterium]
MLVCRPAFKAGRGSWTAAPVGSIPMRSRQLRPLRRRAPRARRTARTARDFLRALNHDTIEIRPVRRDDEAALLEAWHAAFARLDPEARRTPETWRRMWLGAPQGLHAQAAFASDGTCLAHFGGLPMRLRLADGERRAYLVVDSFARLEARQGLARDGLLARCCRAFIAASMDKDRGEWAHGFPVARAWELGRRLLSYEFDDEVRLWTGPLEAFEGAAGPGALAARQATLDEGIDKLDREVHAGLGRIVRSREHLAWRLADDGMACEARDARGALRGFAAARPSMLLGERHLCLLDWIVAKDDDEAAAALLARLAAFGRGTGARRVALLASHLDPHGARWARLGLALVALENTHACFVAGRPDEARALARQIHLTLLDTDLA